MATGIHAHPRTKGTTGYPDPIFDKPYVKNDRYLGVAFKPGMGQDISEERLCEWRCFDAIDTMNNMYAGTGLRPKYLIADIDTYRKGPEDDIYPGHPVNYLKIDRMPGPDDDWTPILQSLRDGNFFVTTGEILITNYTVAGTGDQRTIDGEPRMDVSAGVRGSGLGRRQESRSTDHAGDGPSPEFEQAFRDPVRCGGQVLGALRGMGLGRQRGVRAARLAEPALEGATRAMTIRPTSRALSARMRRSPGSAA